MALESVLVGKGSFGETVVPNMNCILQLTFSKCTKVVPELNNPRLEKENTMTVFYM